MDGDSLLGNQDLLYELINHLEAEGISSISYNRFGASKNQTITKFSSQAGVPAIQIEINSTWVTPNKKDSIKTQRFSKLVPSVVAFYYKSWKIIA